MVKYLLLWFYIECRLIRAVNAVIMIDVLTEDAIEVLVAEVLAMCTTITITIIIVITTPFSHTDCMDLTAITGFAVPFTGKLFDSNIADQENIFFEKEVKPLSVSFTNARHFE